MALMTIPDEDRVDTKWAAEHLGVSVRTVHNLRRRFELHGEQEGTGTTSPWYFDRREVEQLAEDRDHERRTRESVVGYGDFDQQVEVRHGRPAMEQLRKIRERHELLQRVADEVRGDADLRRAFETLDDDEIIERAAHEIAGRVRREERIRRRAAEILAADDHA